jgi:hypothetical protein
MFPASYLFKTLYRNRFEVPDRIETAESDYCGDPRLSRLTVAAMGLNVGAPFLVLGSLLGRPHPRRR